MNGTRIAGALRSGEVAAAAGVNLQTLRYYERRGLLEEPRRTSGGHRAYSPDAVTRLRVIKAAQGLGFTLDEVAGLMEAGRHRHGNRPDTALRQRVTGKLAEIDGKIAALHTIRATLAAALEAGCDDLATCPTKPGCPLPFAELAQEAPAAGPTQQAPTAGLAQETLR